MSDWDNLVEPTRCALEALLRKGDEMADRIEELERRLITAVDALETIRFFSGVHAAGSDLEHIKDSVNDVANKALGTVK